MPDENAPKNLRAVFGSLGSFKHRVRTGKRRRIHRPGENGKQKESFPTAVCDCCSAGYNFSPIVTDKLPETKGQCPDCAKMLREGHYAVKCENGYAFIAVDDTVKDLAGKVVTVRPEVFEQVKKKYADKIKQAKDASRNN